MPWPIFGTANVVDGVPHERRPGCRPASTTLSRVGSIGKFVVYDLKYYSADDPNSAGATSILVRAPSGRYREIYYRETTQPDASIASTGIVQIGGERTVRAIYNVGGRYAAFDERYFSFGAHGAKLMHIEPLVLAAKRQLPADSTIYLPESEFDFEAMTWTVWTEPTNTSASAKLACCDGSVTVRFKIVHGDFVVVSAVYEKD
jgi:hypothetical protein